MSPISRRARFIDALPVLASFAVFGIALDRVGFALVAALACCAVIWLGIERAFDSLGVALAGAAGGVAGLLLLSLGELPKGPIPSTFLGPLSGAIVGFAAYCVLQRKNLYAWIYAGLLVVVSLNTPPTGALWGALACLGVATLVAVFHSSGFATAGARGWLGFALFGFLAGGAAVGLAVGVRASEGALVSLVYDYLRGLDPPAGVGFDSSVSLLSRAQVEPTSRELFEIEGRPERLRTVIYELFDGAQFTMSPESSRPLPAPRADEPLSRTELVLFESLGQRWPALAGTRRVVGGPSEVRRGWIWAGQGEPGLPIALENAARDVLPPEPVPGAELTFVPDDIRPEFLEIERRVVGDAAGAREKARRIEAWLQREFLYSLRTDLRGKAHPLLVMLREKRPAYCVYFASAMAVLLRSDGVPARLVGGFLPAESNALTGRTVVRQRDAHAWVEVFVPEESRWVPFDPTPSDSRDDELGLDRDRGVLGDALAALGSTLRRAWARFRHDPAAFIADLASSPWVFGPLALAGAWVLWRRRRSLQRTTRTREALVADRELQALYRRYARMLQRWNIEPAAGDSDDEVLAQVQARRGDAAARAAEAFVTSYRAVRYGGRPDRAALEERLAALESLRG